MKKIIFMVMTLVSALTMAQGEQKQVFGNVEVHYMIMNSTTLPAEVAEAYGIRRSGRLGFMMLSVLEYQPDAQLPVPVPALITASFKNLIGQQTQVEMTEIREQDGLYYIATFSFDNEDIYRFAFDVRLDANQTSPFHLDIQQRMYFE